MRASRSISSSGSSGFGGSGKYQDLYKHFGITPEAVADAALKKLD